MTRTVFIALIAAACAAPAAGQIPDTFTNLRVLPEDIPRDSLVGIMRGFALALGVRCQYCHVGGDSLTLQGVRFADDDDEDKEKARAMMRMVATINDDLLAALPHRDAPPVAVRCVTCHGGLARPETLEAALERTIRDAGADSAVAHYRALRERYFGTAAYDFSALRLVELARSLSRDGRADDAARMLVLNTEVHPRHAPTWVALADARLATADTAAAITALEQALELEPGNPLATRRLQQLRR